MLTPWFLAGLLALAVPIFVHLSDRDRRDVVRFPSLKFLTGLPYRQVRRQKIRHRRLFALRALALTLLVLAFARPYWGRGGAAAGSEAGRDVVIALDRSYSMAHGDTWDRAQQAVRDAVDALPNASRIALVAFDDQADIIVASTTDVPAITQAAAALRPGSGSTRLTPVLRLANDLLLDTTVAAAGSDREVVLISDFQASSWNRSEDAGLIAGARLTAVDVSTPQPVNVTLAGVEVRRAEGESPSLMLAARLVNRSAVARQVPITVTVEGEEVLRSRADLAAGASEALLLGPIAGEPGSVEAGSVEDSRRRITVRIGDDPLAPDNVFHLVTSPRPPLAVLLVESPDARDDATLYLREALRVAEDPAFEVTRRAAPQVRSEDIRAARVIILHDTPWPGGVLGQALRDHVSAGAGLWMVLGAGTPQVPDGEVASVLPGAWRDTVDRLDTRGVSLAHVATDHPVFEIFSGSDAGNLSAPRFYRYRPIVLPPGNTAEPTQTVLAHYTDGAVALAESQHGAGRVLLWGSPLGNRWSNLPIHSVFPPFVHQVCRRLSGDRRRSAWHRVGEAIDLGDTDLGDAVVTLDEAGFHEIPRPESDPPFHLVAVNVDRSEADLTGLDVQAFVAASTSLADPATSVASAARHLSREARERGQGLWWYLVLAALLLLAMESVWSNRIRGHV